MRYFARVLVPTERELVLSPSTVLTFFEGVRKLAVPKGPLVLQTRACAEDRYVKGESFSVADPAIARALAEEDGDLGQKLLASPDSIFAKALGLTVDARAIVSVSFRSREVSLSDPHEDVTAKATRLPYGTICRRPVEVGVFRHPETKETVEVPGAGSGRIWVSVAVFDGEGALPPAGEALATLARGLVGPYIEATHWLR